MTPAEILDLNHYSELFSEPNSLEMEYRRLVKMWHPDVNDNPAANDVFVKINDFYDRAKFAIINGSWQSPNILFLTASTGKKYRISFLRHHKFPLGDFYVGNISVTYVFNEKYKGLSDNFSSIQKSLKFSSVKMKDEFSKYLPQDQICFEVSGKKVVIVKKTPDLLLLRDIVSWLSHAKDNDRHVAWIISSLLNLNCYLEYAGISHNDISIDTYFISPIYHSGALLGGWEYASVLGEKLHALPKSTINLVPPKVLSTKITSRSINRELIRNIGRTLLGDETGLRLKGKAPEPMIDWLRCSFVKTAYEDYKLWGDVLKESFGPRKFVKMEINADLIYGKGKI